MKKKFKIIDAFTGEKLKLSEGQTIVMNDQGIFFLVGNFRDYDTYVRKLSDVCPKYDVIWQDEAPAYTGTGSDYLDCVLGIGGFEQYGPIQGVKGLTDDEYLGERSDQMTICKKCRKVEGTNDICPYCNWKHLMKEQRQGQRERILKEMNPIEIVCYQIEIVVPTGTHSYIYSDKIPTDESLKENYGMFAKVGNVDPLMHVVQHKQLLSDAVKFWSEK